MFRRKPKVVEAPERPDYEKITEMEMDLGLAEDMRPAFVEAFRKVTCRNPSTEELRGFIKATHWGSN